MLNLLLIRTIYSGGYATTSIQFVISWKSQGEIIEVECRPFERFKTKVKPTNLAHDIKKRCCLIIQWLITWKPNWKLRIYTISLLFSGHVPSVFRPFFGKPYGPTPGGLLKPNTRMMIWISLEPQSLDSKNATKSQPSPLDMTFANHRSSACFQHSCFCFIPINMSIKVLNCSNKWQNNNLYEGVVRAKYIKCCCRNQWMPYLTAEWTLDFK